MKGIVCPICGGDTYVHETRNRLGSVRRRRRCESLGCNGRLTTVELVALVGGVDLVAVPKGEIDRLQWLAANLAKYCSTDAAENSCASPDRSDTSGDA